MFAYATPAEVGISAKHIKKYIDILERYNLATHSIILAKGNKIIFEKYWAPFDASYMHRQYSATKSIVSIAIGFAEQDGLVCLDDKIVDYFPNDIPDGLFENVRNQTVKDMLMMATGYIASRNGWFAHTKDDRVKSYFDVHVELPKNQWEISRMPGEYFAYDSWGSFILGALVERVTKKPLMSYLREKAFDKIGISKDAYFLTCPGGHAWGDSALMCSSLDLLKIARFTLNYGNWDGEQLLNEDYLKTATSKLIDNSPFGVTAYNTFGYGYQIWRTWDDSFSFNGLGCQFAICVPNTDLILIYNGDNQANDPAKSLIFDRFFEEIVHNMSDGPIENDEENQKALDAHCQNLKLHFQKGEYSSETAKQIDGKTFKLKENPMGITEMRFSFNGDMGTLYYTNKTGKKEINFGFGKNIFEDFPEEGYADDMGNVYVPGNYYKCANSATWIEPKKLGILVQVIDKYFGKLYMSISFNKEKTITVNCNKFAEAFMAEYSGWAEGTMTN